MLSANAVYVDCLPRAPRARRGRWLEPADVGLATKRRRLPFATMTPVRTNVSASVGVWRLGAVALCLLEELPHRFLGTQRAGARPCLRGALLDAATDHGRQIKAAIAVLLAAVVESALLKHLLARTSQNGRRPHRRRRLGRRFGLLRWLNLRARGELKLAAGVGLSRWCGATRARSAQKARRGEHCRAGDRSYQSRLSAR